MTQADRDRLVTLKKAKKKLITQHEAAEELGMSVRQVRRLMYGAEGARRQSRGARAARRSHRTGEIEEKIEREGGEDFVGAGVSRFRADAGGGVLGKKHGIEASKETVRQWMMRAKLWRGKKAEGRAGARGGRGGAGWASWCSGTPASTTGWKGVARSCT